GDTKNSINYEQKLADGKIKIGDFWYASIDDYLNNNPIITGIVVDKETLELKKKESEEAEGEEVLEGTITASVFGMDQEPEITWEVTPADQTAVTLSGTTGKTITVTAVGTVGATVTITAKCTYEGNEYTAPCEVSLKILKNISKGAFVEYGVAYTDAYIEKDYSTTNGWRLLDYTVNEEDGTISNVKLISTGIPAKLYYKYSDTSTNKSWWVTTESSEDPSVPNLTDFKEVLGGSDNYTFYTGELSAYIGLQASAGMYYNFKNIKFAYGTASRGYNLGHFTSITTTEPGTTNKTTYDSNNKVEKQGIDLFKARTDVTDIRLLTLKEVNEAIGRTDIDSTTTVSTTEDSIGLYRLDQLKNVTGMEIYDYNSRPNGNYWLASPWPNGSSDCSVCQGEFDGFLYASSQVILGVRPLVCLVSETHYRVGIETDSITGIDYYTLTAE
ncbi:MAG: hypothetical protein J6A29_04755, partial [Clostridia bacterium]|nr:hypothetical protein [Clostridia bacterium]